MAKRKKIDADLDNLMPILIGMWRKMFKESGPKDELQTREFRTFVGHVKELLDLEEKEGALESALKKRELLGAYLLYFFPLKYQEALSLIGEIPVHGIKALDVSIAPSPFGLAASKYGYTEVTSLGPLEEALQLGAEVAGRSGFTQGIRKEALSTLKPLRDSFDLITLSYTLFDLFPSDSRADIEKRKELVLKLISALSKDGFLILVESSIEKKNKRFLELRDVINENGFAIQAPCIYQGRCPALANKNVCFAQRDVEKPYLINEANRAGKINMNSLKMSYLIIKSRENKPKEPQKDLYRIIGPPFEDRGRKTFYLCGTRGRKKLSSSLKENSNGTKAFEYLKRGEAIEVEKAKEEGNTYVLDEGSQIRIAAPLSKPLL